MRNDSGSFNSEQWNVAKELRANGYTTAAVGKWHLKSKPTGFDYWEIYPDQGNYYHPEFRRMDGTLKRETGYSSDLEASKSIDWLERRDKDKPFFLMCEFKAPHRTFCPPIKYLGAFDGVEIPEPPTLFDDYAKRSPTLAANEMSIDGFMQWGYDLKVSKEERGDLKLKPEDIYSDPERKRMTPEEQQAWDAHFGPRNQQFLKDHAAGKLSPKDVLRWKYQRYMHNYLGAVKAVDENVGRLLAYLDEHGLTQDTVVIYGSDQGFYLGEHGWFDKRWMFEESLEMPFLIRWPGIVKPGSRPEGLIQNIDYAPTFLEMAGLKAPGNLDGRSIVPLLKGEAPADWRKAIYYAYYELGEHNVPQHFGVRTATHKLFHLPASKEWQLFDLVKDPNELVDQSANPEYAAVRKELEEMYHALRKQYDAPTYEKYGPDTFKWSR
jgi:arylsulfatase A-like enzyme